MVSAMAHAAVTTRDMEESLRFYTQALGLKPAFELNDPKDGSPMIVYLNVAKGQFVELFYNGKKENPFKSENIGFNHLCFQVEDIYQAVEQVKRAGFAIDVEPKQGMDFNWQAWTTDPNGVRIELMQISPESPHAPFM